MDGPRVACAHSRGLALPRLQDGVGTGRSDVCGVRVGDDVNNLSKSQVRRIAAQKGITQPDFSETRGVARYTLCGHCLTFYPSDGEHHCEGFDTGTVSSTTGKGHVTTNFRKIGT